MMKPKHHLLFIDGMRALAALYVLAHHAVLQYYSPGTFAEHHYTGFKKKSLLLFFSGHFAVDVFIVLSGFSLALSILKNDYAIKGGVWNYLKKRVIRIVPAYYLAICLAVVLAYFFINEKTGTLWDTSLPVNSFGIITHLLMVSDFFNSSLTRVNYSLWSIGVEFRIYLFFPLLVLIWKKWGAVSGLISSVLLAVISSVLLVFLSGYYSDVNYFFTGVSPYIILFALGMLSADVAFGKSRFAATLRNIYLRMPESIKLTVIAFAVILFFAGKILIERSGVLGWANWFVIDVWLGLFFGMLLIICALTNSRERKISWITSALSWRPLIFIGTFSYSIYLIHSPLLQLLSQYVLMPLNYDLYTTTWLLVFLGSPVIVLAAYLFFLFAEKPFLNGFRNQKFESTAINAVEKPAP